ncbi:MAG: SRPBCC domain-containing protein [Terrimesophilobacter sp.]
MIAASGFEIERRIELPPSIVWDALVDPELAVGWLADASIDLRVGGHYDLTWHRDGVRRVGPGVITELRERTLLTVDTARHGLLSFHLDEVPGGNRGTSTQLRLSVKLGVDPRSVARVRADWETRLDQLEDLLRGHPVDWMNWVRDYGDAWNAYLEESEPGQERRDSSSSTPRRQSR